MGFFKSLAYVYCGFGVGGAAAYGAAKIVSDKIEEDKEQARREGIKAGEASAAQKYEEKVSQLSKRLHGYHDFEEKVLGLYAIGLAVANADGVICKEEEDELEAFVGGCAASGFPEALKETIKQLKTSPPTIESALNFASKSKLPKRDIDDVIDIIAMTYPKPGCEDWFNSLQQAIGLARTQWIAIQADKKQKFYEVLPVAKNKLAQPEWFDCEFADVLEVAFFDRMVRTQQDAEKYFQKKSVRRVLREEFDE